jgi:hypothetical protein
VTISDARHLKLGKNLVDASPVRMEMLVENALHDGKSWKISRRIQAAATKELVSLDG